MPVEICYKVQLHVVGANGKLSTMHTDRRTFIAAIAAMCAAVLWVVPSQAVNYDALGYPDENGNFVLTEEGRRLAEKTPVLPEARFWGTKPLGEPGHLTWPTNFARRAKFRDPTKRLEGPGLILFDGSRRAVVVNLSKEKFISKLAGEFAWHMEKMTGAEVERAKALPPESRPAVVFGEDEAARAFGIDLAALGSETAVVKRKGEWLYIGGNTVGASHALTYVLESLGCRYLWPGALGKVIPKKGKVVLLDTSLLREPEFVCRKRQFEYAPEFRKEAIRWLGLDPEDYVKRSHAATGERHGRWFWLWHGMEEQYVFWPRRLPEYPWGHSFDDYRKRFRKEHPEWFSLQRDGTRGVYGKSLCLSNNELVRQVAADKIAYLRKTPHAVCASICLPDGDYSAQCMCENCRKLDPVNGPGVKMEVFKPQQFTFRYVSLTDRVLHFANRVAELVTRELPDRKLCLYAYHLQSAPPVRLKPHPALIIVNVAGALQNMGWAERNLAGWGATGNMQMWRPNFLIGVTSPLPQCWAERIFNQLEDAKANGLKGFEASNICKQWAVKGFTWYVIAKAMVNHRRESFAEVRDDWCRAGFGPAAETVKRYLAAVEEASWAAIERHRAEGLNKLMEWYSKDDKARVLVEELEKRNLPAIIAQARDEASVDAEALARVNFLATGIEYLKLYGELARAKTSGDKDRFEEQRRKLLDFARSEALRDPVAVFPAQLGEINSPYMRTEMK